MNEILTGIIVAVAIIKLSQWLSKYFDTKLIAATILVSIAFIYVGFSLKENRIDRILLETGFAMFLYFIAIIGYTRNSSLLAYGIIFHGVWDIFHHSGLLIKADIPEYWPSFCFVVDIIDGLFFLYLFKKHQVAYSGIDDGN